MTDTDARPKKLAQRLAPVVDDRHRPIGRLTVETIMDHLREVAENQALTPLMPIVASVGGNTGNQTAAGDSGVSHGTNPVRQPQLPVPQGNQHQPT